MEKKTLRKAVLKVLTKSEKARANDNELIYQVLRELDLPTGYSELRFRASNIASAITRERNYCLKHNPLLQPAKHVVKRRQALEKKNAKEFAY